MASDSVFAVLRVNAVTPKMSTFNLTGRLRLLGICALFLIAIAIWIPVSAVPGETIVGFSDRACILLRADRA